MGEGPDRGGGGRGGELDRRTASLVLSSLVLTPDGLLEVFRRRRPLAAGMDVELLRRARDVLDQISLALLCDDPARHARLVRVWRALCEGAGSPAAEQAAPTAPEPAGASPRDGGKSGEPPWLSSRGDSAQPVLPPPAVPAPPEVVAAPAAAAATATPFATRGSSESAPAAPVPPPERSSAVGASAPGRHDEPPSWPSTGASAGVPLAADSAPSRPTAPPEAVGDALPFRPAEGRPPPPAAGPADSPPVGLGQTLSNEILSPLANLVLPFETAAAADAGGGASAPPAGDQRSVPAAGAPAAGSEPMPAPTAPAAVPFRPPKPKPPPHRRPSRPREPVEAGRAELPGHLQTLTLEHYAALCAECHVHPERASAIQERYHVQSDAERVLLDGHWHGRMQAEPQLAERFRWLSQHYESWARQQSG